MLVKIITGTEAHVYKFHGELVGCVAFDTDRYLMDIASLRDLHGHVGWVISRLEDIAVSSRAAADEEKLKKEGELTQRTEHVPADEKVRKIDD